jgi:hypothetical protein
MEAPLPPAVRVWILHGEADTGGEPAEGWITHACLVRRPPLVVGCWATQTAGTPRFTPRVSDPIRQAQMPATGRSAQARLACRDGCPTSSPALCHPLPFVLPSHRCRPARRASTASSSHPPSAPACRTAQRNATLRRRTSSTCPPHDGSPSHPRRRLQRPLALRRRQQAVSRSGPRTTFWAHTTSWAGDWFEGAASRHGPGVAAQARLHARLPHGAGPHAASWRRDARLHAGAARPRACSGPGPLACMLA